MIYFLVSPLEWSIYDRDLAYLHKLLGRYIGKEVKERLFIDVLICQEDISINWKGKTSELAYLFHLFSLRSIMHSPKWQKVIEERRMFRSKQGNFITAQNLASSLSEIQRYIKNNPTPKNIRQIEVIADKLNNYSQPRKHHVWVPSSSF